MRATNFLKLIFCGALLLGSAAAFAYDFPGGYDGGKLKASYMSTDTTEFDNNLSSLDTDVQKALETLDEMVSGGGGTPGGSNTQVQYNNAGAFGGVSGATTNGTAVTYATDGLLVNNVKAATTSGILDETANGTDISLFGAANSANGTFYGNVNFDTVTASTIAGFGGSKTLQSLSTATYPSLTELSYVKGVTAALQTQIDSKAAHATTITIAGTANEISSSAGAQDLSANRTWTLSLPSYVDFGGKSLELPNSTTLPATCTVGEIYMDTDATTGQRLYACESTNTWVLQGDGGGGGATNWNDIGDATGDGTIALGAHETDFTSTIDAAGESIWTITNTDAVAANANTFITLQHNDFENNNITYLSFIGDVDGTPTQDYSITQTGAVFSRPFSVLNSPGGSYALDTTGRGLYDSSNIDSVLWGSRDLLDVDGNDSVDWRFRELIDEAGNVALSWEGKIANDSADTTVIDWGSKILYDTDGGDSLDWHNRNIYQADGELVAEIENAILNDDSGIDALNWNSRKLYDSGINETLDWQAKTLIDGGSVTYDWDNQVFYAAHSFGNGATSAGEIRILEDTDDGSEYTSFTVPALGATVNYTLPPDDGDPGEVLTTDGSAVLTWEPPGGGSGDVTAVGDCASGDCYDGTSDGGTYMRLYDGDSHYGAFVTANLAANRTYTFGNLDLTFDQSVASGATPTFTGTNITAVASGDSATSFFSSGTIEGARLGTFSKSFVITGVTSSGDFGAIWKTPHAITITSVNVVQVGATNVIGHLDECDSNGANCVSVDSSDITADGGNDADDGSLSNATIDANDWIGWHTTSVSGTNTTTSVTFNYTIN